MMGRDREMVGEKVVQIYYASERLATAGRRGRTT